MDEIAHKLAYAALRICAVEVKGRKLVKIMAGHETFNALMKLRLENIGHPLDWRGGAYKMFGVPVDEIDEPHRLTFVYRDGSDYEAETVLALLEPLTK